MPISHKYRCIFVHIPKCAGTSIEAALGMHGAVANVGLEPYVNQTVNPDTFFGADAQHYSIRYIQSRVEAKVFNEYFKFAFVRNPYDRFVSPVAWKADHTGELKWYRNVEPTQAEFNNALYRLLRDRIAGRPLHPHLIPQSEFVVDSTGKLCVDFIGKIENLEDDWIEVSDQIGVRVPLEMRMKSAHRPYTEYYNFITRFLLWLVYRKDAKRFGYTFR